MPDYPWPMPRHWFTGRPAPTEGHYLICHNCTDLADECEDPDCQDTHPHYSTEGKRYCCETCRAFDAS